MDDFWFYVGLGCALILYPLAAAITGLIEAKTEAIRAQYGSDGDDEAFEEDEDEEFFYTTVERIELTFNDGWVARRTILDSKAAPCSIEQACASISAEIDDLMAKQDATLIDPAQRAHLTVELEVHSDDVLIDYVLPPEFLKKLGDLDIALRLSNHED